MGKLHLSNQSTPSPSRGGIKGGGRLAPSTGACPHPLPTSPVEGEVLSGAGGKMVLHVN
jgi:hypothetical protein